MKFVMISYCWAYTNLAFFFDSIKLIDIYFYNNCFICLYLRDIWLTPIQTYQTFWRTIWFLETGRDFHRTKGFQKKCSRFLESDFPLVEYSVSFKIVFRSANLGCLYCIIYLVLVTLFCLWEQFIRTPASNLAKT